MTSPTVSVDSFFIAFLTDAMGTNAQSVLAALNLLHKLEHTEVGLAVLSHLQ